MAATTAFADDINLHSFSQGEPAKASDINGNFQALKDEIQSLKARLAKIEKWQGTLPKETATQRPIPPTGIKTFEQDGFIFTLKDCKRSSANVQCNMSIMSKDNDGTIVYGYSDTPNILYDDVGNSYQPSGVQLGNNPGNYGSKVLIGGISTPYTLVFNNISGQAKVIMRLDLGYKANNTSKSFQFRNIPIN